MTNYKLILKRLFTLGMLLLASPLWLMTNAQDLTRKVWAYSDTTIIRQYDEDTWICYNYAGEKGNEFYEVHSSGSTTPFMGLYDRNLRILDFEIFRDTVFFCGYTGQDKRTAVMGFFPLSTFPTSTVKYNVLSELMSFDRLEVFAAERQVHVVMTASCHGMWWILSNNTIVDARQNSDGSWLFCVLDKEVVECTFDDVTVSDSNVFFVGRSAHDYEVDLFPLFNTSELWCFEKPVLYGVPVFLNQVDIGYLWNWPSTRISIEHITEDWVAIASRNVNDVIVSSLFKRTYYPNATCKIILDDTIEARDVLDIKYNKPANRFEILTGRGKTDIWNSLVFTVPYPNHFVSGTVSMHTIAGHRVQSLDFIESAPNYFVASGHDTGWNLNVYKYNQAVNGNCFPLSDVPSKKVFYNSTENEIDIKVINYLVEPVILETYYGDVQTETTCE